MRLETNDHKFFFLHESKLFRITKQKHGGYLFEIKFDSQGVLRSKFPCQLRDACLCDRSTLQSAIQIVEKHSLTRKDLLVPVFYDDDCLLPYLGPHLELEYRQGDKLFTLSEWGDRSLKTPYVEPTHILYRNAIDAARDLWKLFLACKDPSRQVFPWLRKSPSPKRQTAQVRFFITANPLKWTVHLYSNTQDQKPCEQAPEITIICQPEQYKQPSEVSLLFNNTRVVMKSVRQSNEALPLVLEPCGYDQYNRCMVTFSAENAYIAVATEEIPDAQWGERFYYQYTPADIVFRNRELVVMELWPTLDLLSTTNNRMEGWIAESYLQYLPYLCGLFGYEKLNF